MANVPTVSWDETSPAGTQAISLGDDRIREAKKQIREIIDVDHDFPSAGQAADNGQHKQVTLQEQANLGTGAEGVPILGAQTVGGKAELVFTDEDDNDVQLTKGGVAKALQDILDGNQTIAPATAIVGLTIDQDEDAEGQIIDSESVTYNTLLVFGKFCLALEQNISNGRGLRVERDIAEAGSLALVHFIEDNVAGTQPVLEIKNDGSGNDIIAPNFTLKNGYIAPGGLEAMRWDVVSMDLDGTTSDSVAYTLDGTKCRGLFVTGYDVSTDDVVVMVNLDLAAVIGAAHDGANLHVGYGVLWAAGDDAHIIIMTVA